MKDKENHLVKMTELRDHMIDYGKEGLLPQHLTPNLLDYMWKEAETIDDVSQNITPNFMLFITVMFLLKGPEMFEDCEVTVDKKLFMQSLELYISAITLEGRRSVGIIDISHSSLPTLETIFDPESEMDITIIKPENN